MTSGSLTYAQLEGVWLEAASGTQYATKTWAALMAAIAEAESGGNPQATNPDDNNGTQTSWGLWQISLGNHEAPSPTWNNPLTNAQLALGKLQTQGLGAWGTYTSGAYQAYLSGSTTPDTDLSSIELDSAVQGAAAAQQAEQQSNCLWNLSGSLFGFNASLCVLSKSEVRAMTGMMLAGLGGLIILSSLGLAALMAGLKVAEPLISGSNPVGRTASVIRRVRAPGAFGAYSTAPRA